MGKTPFTFEFHKVVTVVFPHKHEIERFKTLYGRPAQ